jgi:mono/diheme cytochrome c family protein
VTHLRIILLGGLALLAAAAAFGVYAWAPVMAPIAPPPAASFAPALVARGATLAALGNCVSCHTQEGEPSFSGGRPLATPFGTLYSSNLTPDPATGLGRWSADAFIMAMREGLDREGRHLYPAFPYDHFTLVSDDDDRALYAYLMTRTPVPHPTPAPDLMFPLNFRMTVAGWKLLFFHSGAWHPDPARDHAWNRGTYLVEGLGHCGACHTPRNLLGAEERDKAYAGGQVDGWSAYALNAASPAPIPWTVEAMTAYLAHGWVADHGVSRGPMAEVTLNLATVPADDLAAMGTTLVSGMGTPAPDRVARAQALHDAEDAWPSPASAGRQMVVPSASGDVTGAAIFAGACASCHAGDPTPAGGRGLPGGGLPLALSTALHAPDPSNLIAVTLRGLMPPHEGTSALMPGFAASLSNDDVVALLNYLRGTVAKEPPWPHLADTVRDVAARNRGPGQRGAAPVGIGGPS